MAKNKTPNDHELWFELLQKPKSKKEETQLKQIDDVIDRFVEKGLVVGEDPQKGLRRAIAEIQRQERKAKQRKKTILIVSLVVIVAILLGAGFLFYQNWNEEQKIIAQTQSQKEIEAQETNVSMEKTWDFVPTATPTETPIPTPTEMPTPTPRPRYDWEDETALLPVNISLNCESGVDGESGNCEWDKQAVSVESGYYAVYVLYPDTQIDSLPISAKLSGLSETGEDLIIDLSKCISQLPGDKCFAGVVEVTDQEREKLGNPINEQDAFENVLNDQNTIDNPIVDQNTFEIVPNDQTTIDNPRDQDTFEIPLNDQNITANPPDEQITTGNLLTIELNRVTLETFELYYQEVVVDILLQSNLEDENIKSEVCQIENTSNLNPTETSENGDGSDESGLQFTSVDINTPMPCVVFLNKFSPTIKVGESLLKIVTNDPIEGIRIYAIINGNFSQSDLQPTENQTWIGEIKDQNGSYYVLSAPGEISGRIEILIIKPPTNGSENP